MANDTPAHGPDELAKAADQHQQALAIITETCQAQGLPPGIAQNAAIDFVVLMVLHNFPDDADIMLEKTCMQMRDRLKDLKGAPPVPPRSPRVRPATARPSRRRATRA